MRTPPVSPTAAEVLHVVCRRWLPAASAATHLPLGFGAHHWRIDRGSDPVLFATLDLPGPTRSPGTFEAAYRAAAELARSGLDEMPAPRETRDGAIVVPLAGGLLSVTPWVPARTPTEQDAQDPDHLARLGPLLRRLHAAPVPAALRPWTPRVGVDLAARLQELTAQPWTAGPFGGTARDALRAAAPRIAAWERRWRDLHRQAEAGEERWVPTHGEPHHANQMITEDALMLVDWETFALAPAERDLRSLPEAMRADADPDMLELFALEWGLSEVEEYSRRFHAPHAGDEDDEIAIRDLHEELAR